MTKIQVRPPVLKLAALACLVLAARGVHAAEPLALQKTMKELGANMQVITDGISREDWARVEKNAALLADPTQPTLAG
jgi:hypothetical protein